MRYVVDTHTLVWYFTRDEKLSSKAKEIIQEAEGGRNELIIPVIVLLEALDIQEKKKVQFNISELFNFIEASDNFIIAEIGFSDLRKIVDTGKGLDLHDRLIVLAAKEFEAAVLTKDPQIQEQAQTIW